MADIRKLKPVILKWENSSVKDTKAWEGTTRLGVAMDTYMIYCKQKGRPEPTEEELENLSDEEWTELLKMYYWDCWRADEIQNQSIANLLVDWVWTSGYYGIVVPQKVLGLAVSKDISQTVLDAINHYPLQQELFDKLKQARLDYTARACYARSYTQEAYMQLRARIESFKFLEETA